MASTPSNKPTESERRMHKLKHKQKYSLKELKTLGVQLLSSRAHINNLPLLLTFLNPASPPQHALEALLSLQSFFTPLLPELPSSAIVSSAVESDAMEEPEFIYRTWLRSKFDELVKSLIDIALSPQCDETLREVVLEAIMEFIKVGNRGRFHSAIYHRLLSCIVHSHAPIDFLLDSLASKYFNYIDVRYFTYISLEKLVKTLEAREVSDGGDGDDNGAPSTPSMDLAIHKIHHLISRVPPLESQDKSSPHEMWGGSGSISKEDDPKKLSDLSNAQDKQLRSEQKDNNVLSAAKIIKRMKLKFSKAWISFLRLPLPLDVYKEVLAILHQAVIPYLSNPAVLCDFLTRSYDIGGVVSVMALSSLFILMTEYGLEYPNFYEKLYALLVPSIFMAKHRAKFFQLLDLCLKSPLLPAYLAASFTKKLSRLALSVPPSGALVIIALIHNLLRRHPSINCLVHQEDNDESEEGDLNTKNNTCGVSDHSARKLGIDRFNEEETNPMKTNAMRSSLWEIDTLRHHYCPPVSRFVSSLEEDLTVRAKTTEVDVKDFSSGSYATIFGNEIRRRVKQVPLAFYKATPTCLFAESDFAGWTFKYDEGQAEVRMDENRVEASQENGCAKRQRLDCN